MKKSLSVLVCCLIMAFSSIIFCACETNYDRYKGTFYLYSETSGLTTTSVTKTDTQKIILNKDKTFKSVGYIGEAEGGFEISDDAIVLHFEDKTIVGIVTTTTITVNYNDKILVYKKA